jgi:hypothetical protein
MWLDWSACGVQRAHPVNRQCDVRIRVNALTLCGASLVTCLIIVAAAGTVAVAQNPVQPHDAASVVQAICRQYAAAQHALPYETMYAQCMFARGYAVPGFSPSPDSPGYQGPLPGPFTHGGGGP